ncbi:MAG: methyltransferase [Prevotella sp.]|jgi:tRNA1Val (adenine37-N6)-methyltransferase|nr:methyltransferase [Prevotella sp.]
MGNDYFHFKQFSIWQDKCAMKVGTDGVLLGAWAADGAVCRHILDVGTGTGLIALMLAQRNPGALVQAIDIDESACLQAKANVEASPFAARIRVAHADFSDYASQTGACFDLVVSNPPYFVQSLKSPDSRRSLARHDGSLSLAELTGKGKSLIRPEGRLALILPVERENELEELARSNGLTISRKTFVVPIPEAVPKRLLAELRAGPSACVRENLLVEEARHQYSLAYKDLTAAFYREEHWAGRNKNTWISEKIRG